MPLGTANVAGVGDRLKHKQKGLRKLLLYIHEKISTQRLE